jgi:porphyrinogen peroxidase
VTTSQPIFALGTSSHSYLEFDAVDGATAEELVKALADLDAPRRTTGGVNVVIGFRPEHWSTAAPKAAPVGVHSFDEPVVGADGFTMPATQHDAAIWIAGPSYDLVFDTVLATIAELKPVAVLATEVTGWTYHHDRDLTGFEDGTENPPLVEAPDVALVADGAPGAGGSIWLLQQWQHHTDDWIALDVAHQEQVIGRTKDDSVELDPNPVTSHVTRTDQDDFGDIFRRNTAYGQVNDHGTMFVGFCATQRPLADMLDSMAGVATPRDNLTYYSSALTGAYYFVPSLDDLAEFATPEPDDD